MMPKVSPEPCVPVLMRPPMAWSEMAPRLRTARPCAAAARWTSCMRMPASTVMVIRSRSTCGETTKKKTIKNTVGRSPSECFSANFLCHRAHNNPPDLEQSVEAVQPNEKVAREGNVGRRVRGAQHLHARAVVARLREDVADLVLRGRVEDDGGPAAVRSRPVVDVHVPEARQAHGRRRPRRLLRHAGRHGRWRARSRARPCRLRALLVSAAPSSHLYHRRRRPPPPSSSLGCRRGAPCLAPVAVGFGALLPVSTEIPPTFHPIPPGSQSDCQKRRVRSQVRTSFFELFFSLSAAPTRPSRSEATPPWLPPPCAMPLPPPPA